MAKRKHTAEEIINKLRKAEVIIATGSTVVEAAWRMGVSEQTFYRWRTEYDGLRVDQARRLKQLETKNSPLKRAVAELTLHNQIPKEAAEGNFCAPPVAAFASNTSGQSSGYQSGGPAKCWGNPARPIAMGRWSGMTSRPSPTTSWGWSPGSAPNPTALLARARMVRLSWPSGAGLQAKATRWASTRSSTFRCRLTWRWCRSASSSPCSANRRLVRNTVRPDTSRASATWGAQSSPHLPSAGCGPG